jgi:Protein of unknown function, DUF547
MTTTITQKLWAACLVTTLAFATSAYPISPATALDDTDAAYDAVLLRHVQVGTDGLNRVTYKALAENLADRALLNSYITAQASRTPSKFEKNEAFAYWANLYNAITLKVVVDNYPVSSIKDIKSKGVWLDPGAYLGPWKEKRVTVEGRELSLDAIEHKILRPTFKDPRVHYSVNCASIGCPNLMTKAWRAATLDADLDSAARAFINSPRGTMVTSDGDLKVSSIYKWFQVDFGDTDAGVLAHFKKYAAPTLAAALTKTDKISGDDYNWALNEVANSSK